jgi:uncharacterized protein (TIGR02996 family)
MSPMEQAFLADILEHPDDDTPRLVYADWLDEHAAAVPCARCIDGLYLGDTSTDQPTDTIPCSRCSGTGRVPDGRAARAEFIRVQCELAGPHPIEVRTWHLRRRERELLAAHERGWVDPSAVIFGPLPWRAEFRRGFVEEVTCTGDDWLAHGDAVRAAQPVTRVRLTTWPLVVARAGGRLVLADDPKPRPLHLRDWASEYDGAAPFPHAKMLARLLSRRFPGITVELPVAETVLS